MKFSLAKEHYDFFQKNYFVEFEGMITQDQIDLIRRKIKRKSRHDTPQELYLDNHDLWRSSEPIKKAIFHKRLLSILADLTSEKPLRIGHDQYLPKGFSGEFSLSEMSSFQGLVGGYLICLESSEPKEEPLPFSTEKGNVIFLHMDCTLDFSQLQGDHLLVSVLNKKPIYRFNEADLHTHSYKKLGYVFGDKLQELDFPTVLRHFSL